MLEEALVCAVCTLEAAVVRAADAALRDSMALVFTLVAPAMDVLVARFEAAAVTCAGRAGGAMLGRDLTAGVPPLRPVGSDAFVDGVDVREVAELDTPLLLSCFVGLFTGLLIPLSCEVRLPGVGLAATMLALLPAAASVFLRPFSPVCTLLGRGLAAVAVAPLAVFLAAALGVSSTTFRTPEARRNIP